MLESESLERAVNLLNQAKRVEFYGIGGSAGIAMDAYHKFMRTGINCIAHTDAHLQVMSAGLLDEQCAKNQRSHFIETNVRILKEAHAGIFLHLLEFISFQGNKYQGNVFFMYYMN